MAAQDTLHLAYSAPAFAPTVPSGPASAQAPATRPVTGPAARTPIGQVMVERGIISADEKWRTLEIQASQEARFGELLVSQHLVTPQDVDAALAVQFGTDVADFQAAPLDFDLVNAFGADRALACGHLPWRRDDGQVLIASAKPDLFAIALPEFERLFGRVKMVIASERDIHQALLAFGPDSLKEKAETRVAAQESCRSWAPTLGALVGLCVALLLVMTALWPKPVFYTLLTWTLLTLLLQTALKALAWALALFAPKPVETVPDARPLTRLPTVSILVALYKERDIVGQLVARLHRLDYPAEQLDICLVIEEDDLTTQAALAHIDLPQNFRKIIVPDAKLKTKPRALNYALEFCRGSIVGVYDAEDAPAPDQIRRVAERFHMAPPEVICLQGVLDYYNPHRNWIARCFTIEYATWFRAILPGYLRLGLVIPLGGTTLFFRRRVLEAVGGWDAHNVTEDADLGIRLARYGYRAELIETVTAEEANCRLWPWVKQRSRWLKGYAVTWAVHSRNPIKLMQDLGLWRFLGVQILLLGTLTQFAIAPILWSFWLLTLGFGHMVHQDLGNTVIWAIAGLFIFSETLSIAIRLHAVGKTDHVGLKRWVPSLYFYFPLATLASYKAGFELLTRPFYWDKTAHGTGSIPDQPRPHPALDGSRTP